MTVKGGTTPACAACKYQRRKCSPNCPLAPYFPADQQQTFRNVHRLFGVSNVTKALRDLKTQDQKDDAMKSIIYEAQMRERFPVHGCCAVVCQLKLQLDHAMQELRLTLAQLATCMERSNRGDPSDFCGEEMLYGSSSSSFVANKLFLEQNLLSENVGGFLCGEDMGRPLLCLDSSFSDPMNNNLNAIEAQMNALVIQQQQRNMLCEDYEGVGFNRMIDDGQSYGESKLESYESRAIGDTNDQSYESSSESPLKTAAAGFSLNYCQLE